MALITLLIKYVHHIIFQKGGGGLLLTLLKNQDQSYKHMQALTTYWIFSHSNMLLFIGQCMLKNMYYRVLLLVSFSLQMFEEVSQNV